MCYINSDLEQPMLDPNLLRNHLDTTVTALKRRGYQFDEEQFAALEEKRKVLQQKVEELRNQRNVKSKSIGLAKAKGEDIKAYLQEVSDIGEKLTQEAKALDALQEQITAISWSLPNLPHESVPDGLKEENNVEIRKWGETPVFSFTPKNHEDLAGHDMDFPLATKLSGARFVVLKNQIARLHRALAQFMLDLHTNEHGYTEVNVPVLVHEHCLYGTGQMPKFKADQFYTQDDPPFVLIPTAEVPVTNFLRDEIVDYADLPLKFVCHSNCFRSEAGAYGKDAHGMIRQHQFEKVELVQIVHPSQSYQALEALTNHAETVLKKLKLPYRVVALCAGDMGQSAAKTYDLEVWLPGQNRYREISSCSNTESYQARRMKARFRDPASKKPLLVHTLNGSGLAVGRTLIAVLENYQDDSGNIQVPEVLLPYMNNQKQLTLTAS